MCLYFHRLADLFKKKKRRGKGDVDAFNNLPLERQTWFHGKITADFAQGYLRRDGHFLVREDPAKPGSCFIVVRYKRAPINIPLCKVNSSKGTRIKYRTEDSDKSFDSISELINYYVTEKKPLSSKTPAVITHAVSRDATLLSTDDFKNRYVTNTSPANMLPPKPPGTGPLQQKKLDKFARKNSDPGLHLAVNHGDKNQNGVFGSHMINGHSNSDNLKWTTQPKQREKIPQAFLEKAPKIEGLSGRMYEAPLGGIEAETETENSEDAYHVYEKPDQNLDSDNFYDKPNEPENPSGLVQSANKKEICGQEGDESYYDKPLGTEIEGSFYDEPSVEEPPQAVYDRPPSTGSQNSLGNKSKGSFKDSQENLYDKPRANMECLGSQENLYDKPTAKPKRMQEAFQKSDPKVSAQVETSRPQLVTRCSAPTVRSSPRADVFLEKKRHSGAEEMARQASIKDTSPEGFSVRRGNRTGVESKPHYSTPPKKPNRPSLSRSRSEQSSSVKQEAFHSLRSKSIATDGSKEEERSIQAGQESQKPVDRKGIFLNVMKRIGENLLVPFLESDCLSLARHMTRVDLVSLWGEEPHRHSWSIEDGTGGSKGLEILTLPQGREKRAELLQR